MPGILLQSIIIGGGAVLYCEDTAQDAPRYARNLRGGGTVPLRVATDPSLIHLSCRFYWVVGKAHFGNLVAVHRNKKH